MLKAELAMPGYDEGAMLRSFSRAGARWIPVQADRYVYFDGWHFESDEAKRFSADVAKAVGVMLEEDLPGQAARKGERFMAGLHDLAGKHDLVGEVRGIGLMMGVELVTDRKSKAPAKTQAADVRRICRENGVLVGVGGQLANVVRIQPPLVITDGELDRIIDALATAAAE